MFLSDTPLSICVSPGLGRGWGGPMSGQGHGRRSNIDREKDNALLDCVVGTQLMIQRVLRENDPQPKVS